MLPAYTVQVSKFPRTPISDRFNAQRQVARRQRQRSKHHISTAKILWLFICLIGLTVHTIIVTNVYLEYQVMTETVIGMPDKVDPPATSICFSIWDMIDRTQFNKTSKCLKNRKQAEIIECENELRSNYDIHNILSKQTKSPMSFVISAEIRSPPASNWSAWNGSDDIHRAQQSGQITEFYKGPYKCLMFNAMVNSPDSPTQFKLDRMTTGYPKARFFMTAEMNVKPSATPDLNLIRLFISENGTYPRGSVTLPVVANISKALSYIISYRKIETRYLKYPYVYRCIDYSEVQKVESREHCIEECVKRRISFSFGKGAVPFDNVIVKNHLQEWPISQHYFVAANNGTVEREVEYCSSQECFVDCFTKVFYTTQSEVSSETDTFTVKTRFEEPETIVKFVPKMDLQAYIIYVAGVFSIWFSASIFHSITDVYKFSHKFLLFMRDKISSRIH